MSHDAQPQLSHVEWRAVQIALNDAATYSCLAARQPGRLGQRLAALWRALTGNEPPRPLADPRLEALRRYVCAVRKHARAADAYVSELTAHGYNRAQLDAIRILSA